MTYRLPVFVGLVNCAVALAALLVICNGASAQTARLAAPGIGYVFPPGGKAGATVDVQLGGYDWTPDMQWFVHDSRVKLEFLSPPGKILEPPPPYWFGSKAGSPPLPLPREVRARWTLPADLPPGPVRWQAANANGGTLVGVFMVGTDTEVVEDSSSRDGQSLPPLPVTISGRLFRNAEIDHYRFSTSQAGLVWCELADRLGKPFCGALQIRDREGKVVVDVADTEERGLQFAFMAQAGGEYAVRLQEVDFRGDRSFVYRLSFDQVPRVQAALPAAGKRGEKRAVEFIGRGIVSGADKLESITREVTIPTEPQATSFAYRLETSRGLAKPINLLVSDWEELVEPASGDAKPRAIKAPFAVTSWFDAPGTERVWRFSAAKGDALRIVVEAERLGSPVDALVVVRDATGKEIVRGDDLVDSPDAAVDFKALAEGEYEIAVSDLAARVASRAATFRMTVLPAAAASDFVLNVPEKFDLPIGGKADLLVKLTRLGTFTEAVTVAIDGLPPGVNPAGELVIDPKKKDLKLSLEAAADCESNAVLVRVIGKATLAGKPVEREAGTVLLTCTMKPRCHIAPVDKDGGRTVSRGTTYPAQVIVERLEGYTGNVVLEQSAVQDRHRRGITGPELVVPPGVDRIAYPVYLPEWVETSLTCRIILNGVTQVPDPKGTVRHVVSAIDGRITMSPEGALMKLSHQAPELTVRGGEAFDVPLRLSRSVKVPLPAKLELVVPEELEGLLRADALTLPANQSVGKLRVTTQADARLAGEHELKFRATVMQDGNLPVISETSVPVVFK